MIFELLKDPDTLSVNSNIYILLGSNLGDRKKHLHEAKRRILLAGCIVTQSSSMYQTAPWGKTDQPDFFNQVIEISTVLTPLELLKALLQIETDLGRTRKEKWGERILDLDILFFNDQQITHKDLIIPHPGIVSRRFTLVPLCEIAAEFIHPVLHVSCAMLLKACSDRSRVEKCKD